MIKLTIIVPAYNQEKLLQRALDSLPLSSDYQYILIDDGSTDKTLDIMTKWSDNNIDKVNSVIIHSTSKNKGIASAMNYGFDKALGEYIISLSSDDYFIKGFSQFTKYLNSENDLVYFDLQINNGEIWHVDEETKHKYVGAVKFIRREFLDNIRVPNLKYREDVPFSEQLYKKNPREVFTGIILKHYNYPRIGSLTWQAFEDEKKEANETKE